MIECVLIAINVVLVMFALVVLKLNWQSDYARSSQKKKK